MVIVGKTFFPHVEGTDIVDQLMAIFHQVGRRQSGESKDLDSVTPDIRHFCALFS